MFILFSRKGLFLSVYVDDIKLAEKKQSINPTWKILPKGVDLRGSTSFLDHVSLGCTQRESQISKNIVDNYRSIFKSRTSAWAMEKFQEQKPWRNLMPKRYPHGPMTWKVMRRNVWKDIANLRIKQLNNCTKVATPCMDDHQFQKAFIESVGELSRNVCIWLVLGDLAKWETQHNNAD